MPAVVRGGRRQSSKPPSRPPSKSKAKGAVRRGQGSAPARKLHALGGVGLSPGTTGVAVAAVLLAAGSLVLFTGGRAQALALAANHAVDEAMAHAGFGLARVHVEGASPESLAAIRAKLGLWRGEPLTRLDLGAVKASVEQVGWVKDVKVMRLLPDTLVIAVTERERLAVWQHGGQASVVDTTGQVIAEADASRFAKLPLVVGDGANEAAPAILQLVRQRPALLRRLEALVRVDGRRWDLRLGDGSLVQLPAKGEEAALIQLDRLDHEQRLLELGFARIDLRDPEMIAVRPRQGAKGLASNSAPEAG